MKITTSFNLDERILEKLEGSENRSKLVESLLAQHFGIELNWVPDFIHEIGEALQKRSYNIIYGSAGNYSLVGSHDDVYALQIRPEGSRDIYEAFVTRGGRDLKVRVSRGGSARKNRELYDGIYTSEFSNKPGWSFEDKLTHKGIQKKYSLGREKPSVDKVVADMLELLKIDFSKYDTFKHTDGGNACD